MFTSVSDYIDAGRKQGLSVFLQQNKITFKNISLLDQAFYHRSYANESTGVKINNERLEFLGDSVLGLVTAGYLYQQYPEKPEGELAKIKAVVVSEKTLCSVARKRGIAPLLQLGRGEELSNGRDKPAILADCMEAIIGALYLDSGLKVAGDFILSFLTQEIDNVVANRTGKDCKSILQELSQKKYHTTPIYTLLSRTGPDHDITFTVSVSIVNGLSFGPATGKSHKEAEQQAAKIALDKLTL